LKTKLAGATKVVNVKNPTDASMMTLKKKHAASRIFAEDGGEVGSLRVAMDMTANKSYLPSANLSFKKNTGAPPDASSYTAFRAAQGIDNDTPYSNGGRKQVNGVCIPPKQWSYPSASDRARLLKRCALTSGVHQGPSLYAGERSIRDGCSNLTNSPPVFRKPKSLIASYIPDGNLGGKAYFMRAPPGYQSLGVDGVKIGNWVASKSVSFPYVEEHHGNANIGHKRHYGGRRLIPGMYGNWISLKINKPNFPNRGVSRTNIYVQGVLRFINGVVSPGGDYTLIRQEIADRYGVSINDVIVQVSTGSVVITYTIITNSGAPPPDMNHMAAAVAAIISANPGITALSFTGNDTSATYTLTNSSGVTSSPVAVVYPVAYSSPGRIRMTRTLIAGRTAEVVLVGNGGPGGRGETQETWYGGGGGGAAYLKGIVGPFNTNQDLTLNIPGSQGNVSLSIQGIGSVDVIPGGAGGVERRGIGGDPYGGPGGNFVNTMTSGFRIIQYIPGNNGSPFIGTYTSIPGGQTYTTTLGGASVYQGFGAGGIGGYRMMENGEIVSPGYGSDGYWSLNI